MAETSEPLRAAGVIACSKFGRILMVRRTDGEGWAFPGGGIKEGESPAQAAYREFWEETGYRLGRLGKLQMRRVKDGVDFSTFLASVDDEFVPTLNHEHDAWAWVDPMTTLDEAKFSSAVAPAMQMPVYADDAKADDFEEEQSQPRSQAGKRRASSRPRAAGVEAARRGPREPEEREARQRGSQGRQRDHRQDAFPAEQIGTGGRHGTRTISTSSAWRPSSPRPAARASRAWRPSSPRCRSRAPNRRPKSPRRPRSSSPPAPMAAVLSTVSKDAVAHTLNAAQMKAVETIGEKVTDVVTEGLEYALGLGAAALGVHLRSWSVWP